MRPLTDQHQCPITDPPYTPQLDRLIRQESTPMPTDPNPLTLTYLGDSTFARDAGGYLVLTRERSDGSDVEIRMDPLVLTLFLAWVDEHRREVLEDYWRTSRGRG